MPQQQSAQRSDGIDWFDPPQPDEIEVTLLGPGFGEAVVVHLGSNKWLLVDSCIDPATGRAAALDYLAQIGVQARSAVDMVVATHWHDDHIRGLSQVLEICPDALFCCSSAMQAPELGEMVEAYARQPLGTIGTGVGEIGRILHVMGARGQIVKLATSSRLLRSSPGSPPANMNFEIHSLSLSDAETQRAILNLPRALEKQTKRRAFARNPNHFSVVLWLKIGNVRVLLGADLEETGVPTQGWQAIVGDTTRPPGKASAFKVPHHGSTTGYHQPVWEQLLEQNCHACMMAINPKHRRKRVKLRLIGYRSAPPVGVHHSARVRRAFAFICAMGKDASYRLNSGRPRLAYVHRAGTHSPSELGKNPQNTGV